MSGADTGMKSRAEKGMGDDLKQFFVPNLRREGLDLIRLPVPIRGGGNKSGTDVRRCPQHGTMVGLRSGVVLGVKDAISDETLEFELGSSCLPSDNSRTRLP